MRKKVEVNAALFYLLISLLILRGWADIGQLIA